MFLAPLHPDPFLLWAWRSNRTRRIRSQPLSLDDLLFIMHPAWTYVGLRRDLYRLAARVRRNQRLGLDPWTGLEAPSAQAAP